jgi:serine protease
MNSLAITKVSAKTIIAILLICLTTYSLSIAQNIKEKPYFENTVIVKFKPEFKKMANTGELNQILGTQFSKNNTFTIEQEFPLSESNKSDFKNLSNIDITSIYRIEFSDGSDPAIISSKLEKTGFFLYAEPLYKVELLYVPDDPMNQTDQYWLTNCRAFEAWDIHQGDTNIVIAISDTGIELSHPELIWQIKYNYDDPLDGIDNDMDGYIDNFRGWNFGENNNNVQADISQHGTWVGGIAGAATDNSIGVSGAGFKCKILPLKIMNSEGFLVNAYQSIVYAAEHGCDVINCSWGSSYYQQMAQDVINYAVLAHDILVVAAAGNSNSDLQFFPSSYENVLSVAGTQMDDQKWSPDNSISAQGSTYSYYVDVCAPATNFQSTGPWNGYTLMWGGTSFAAPIVAGYAGLLRSYFPELNANQISELIKAGADNIDTIPYNIPFAGKLGKGRLNMYNSLTMEQPPAIVFHDINNVENTGVVTIQGYFTNYLSDAENLEITAEILNSYGNIPVPEIFSGNLGSMETITGPSLINIVLDEDTPYDYKMLLKLNFVADNYESSQVIEIYVNPGFKDISTDKLNLSVTGNGRHGYSDNNSITGNGLVYDNLYSLLYDCGIISGNSAVNLYSSVRQNTDFRTEEYPHFIENDFSDFQIRTEISDSNDATPAGLYIIQDVYSWLGSENSSFIIVDYSIINSSEYDIENFYFGLFTDWDLIDAANNSVIYDETLGFMYCTSDNAQDMNAGIKLLSNHIPRNYALAQIDGGDEIIDITDGLLDIEKFHMISNSTDGIEGPSDMVVYNGAGPFNIEAKDTVVVGFAIIAAPSVFSVNEAIETASDLYTDVLHPQSIENETWNNLTIFPNPATNLINFRNTGYVSQDNCLQIISITGQIVMQINGFSGESIDISELESGLYILKFSDNNNEFVRKITVIGE